MELYKSYLEELHDGKSLVHNETGFASYHIRNNELGKECYIEDIYIVPKHRRTRAAHKLADEIVKIAKEQNCNILTGTVNPEANNSTTSLKMMLSYGFELLISTNETIWFKKDL